MGLICNVWKACHRRFTSLPEETRGRINGFEGVSGMPKDDAVPSASWGELLSISKYAFELEQKRMKASVDSSEKWFKRTTDMSILSTGIVALLASHRDFGFWWFASLVSSIAAIAFFAIAARLVYANMGKVEWSQPDSIQGDLERPGDSEDGWSVTLPTLSDRIDAYIRSAIRNDYRVNRMVDRVHLSHQLFAFGVVALMLAVLAVGPVVFASPPQ